MKQALLSFICTFAILYNGNAQNTSVIPPKVLGEVKMDNGIIYRVHDFIWGDDFGMFKQAGDENWKGVVLYVSLENSTEKEVPHDFIILSTVLYSTVGRYGVADGRATVIKSVMKSKGRIPKDIESQNAINANSIKVLKPHQKIGCWGTAFAMKKTDSGPFYLDFKSGLSGKTYTMKLKL